MAVLAAGTRQQGTWSYVDAGAQRNSGRMWLPVITAANQVAQSGFWTALLAALDGLSLSVRVRDKYVDDTTYPNVPPTNGAANEVALKMIFRNSTTGQTWESYLPGLDVSKISYDTNYGAKNVVLMTGTEVVALIDALADITPKNPYDYTLNGTLVGLQVVRGFK